MSFQLSVIQVLDNMKTLLDANDYPSFMKECVKLDDIEEEIIDAKDDSTDINPDLDWMHNYLFYKEARLVNLVDRAETMKRNKFVRCVMDTRLSDLMREYYECSNCKTTHEINHLSDRYSRECVL